MEQTARQREEKMLRRCVYVACGQAGGDAVDGREANVFRVAAMVLQSSFPVESKRLKEAAERYFSVSPEELTPVVDVVRSGDVISLPRLRDSLSWLLRHRGMH